MEDPSKLYGAIPSSRESTNERNENSGEFSGSSAEDSSRSPDPDNRIHFSKEIEQGFKSKAYLTLETMVEKIRKYNTDFRGSRIPTFEKKFVEQRIILARKAEEKKQKMLLKQMKQHKRRTQKVRQSAVQNDNNKV